MRKFFNFLILTTLFLNLLTSPQTTLAQGSVDTGPYNLETQTSAYLNQTGLGTKAPNVIISSIIKWILSFLGIIFLIIIIYAGFTWMTSAGNEDKISKAKKAMVAGIIGAAIVICGYIITYFVIDSLLIASGSESLDDSKF